MQWQYHVVSIDTLGFMGISPGQFDPVMLQNHLNMLGVDGWELASTFDTAGGNGGTRSINLIFKRLIGGAVPPFPPPQRQS